MSPIHGHQPDAANAKPLSDADLQEISGGLSTPITSLKVVQPLLIRELACRQGVPWDVIKAGGFRQLLSNPLGR
jgi:hypothetical protein